ncbi:MAG: CDGSH iron-sulfur domain-containing protein [Coprobacter sp.]|nr:CDGSH iron-sulfur domain-containing protein [Coprobacter sp.]
MADRIERYYIKITPDGPYLVYGQPPVDQEIILPNEEGDSWVYRKGRHFASDANPIALCRCGTSKSSPFCDGSHTKACWDSRETSDHRPILENVDQIEGPTQILADNEKYCAFARFCDAYGRVWNLVETAETDEEKELVRYETGHCPAGRLILWDKEKKQFFEPPFDPSVGIIEDPGLKVSGPIWVKGGIRIESADGTSYEIRNRVTLCRCGQSANKPFCDGTHTSMHFHDGLPVEPGHDEW